MEPTVEFTTGQIIGLCLLLAFGLIIMYGMYKIQEDRYNERKGNKK